MKPTSPLHKPIRKLQTLETILLLSISFCFVSVMSTVANAQQPSAGYCRNVAKPSSSAFLKFLDTQDFMASAASLLHAKTRPYKTLSGCRYAFDIRWLDQQGIVHQQLFDAITQQLIDIPPPRRPKHPPRGSRFPRLTETPPNHGLPPEINNSKPRTPENNTSRQPSNGGAGGGGGGRGRP